MSITLLAAGFKKVMGFNNVIIGSIWENSRLKPWKLEKASDTEGENSLEDRNLKDKNYRC